MNISYTRIGDYLLPDLYLEKDENYGRLGRYGILRLHFIAQNKQALYETLLMTNKLTHHLLLVSDSCESLYKILMDDYIKNDKRLSEKSKELNPIEWTKLMNNYKNMAEEIAALFKKKAEIQLCPKEDLRYTSFSFYSKAVIISRVKKLNDSYIVENTSCGKDINCKEKYIEELSDVVSTYIK